MEMVYEYTRNTVHRWMELFKNIHRGTVSKWSINSESFWIHTWILFFFSLQHKFFSPSYCAVLKPKYLLEFFSEK